MEITATEFKTNFGHYLDLVPTEDIWITKNGKVVVRLVNPNVSAVDSISGILKGKVSEEIDRHSIRDERRGTIFAKKMRRERRIPFEVSVDPFYSEGNMAYLARVTSEIDSGKAHLLTNELAED